MPEGEAIGGPEGFDEARTQDGATELLLLLEPTTRATSHFEEKRSRRNSDQPRRHWSTKTLWIMGPKTSSSGR
jgi:hypothetical protein